MKIKFIANSCYIFEYQGFQLLSDPWFFDGAFEGSWCHYPPLTSNLNQILKDINAIYISHIHPDHCDPLTLEHVRRDMPLIILDRQPNFLKRFLENLGFHNFIEILDSDTQAVGPFSITMHGPFSGNAFHESEIGNLIDSAITLQAGQMTVLNANDNFPTPQACNSIKKRFGSLTAAILPFNSAGDYPSSCVNLSHEEKMQEKQRILERNLARMAECVDILEPQFIMPAASQYVLGGKERHKNPYLPKTTIDEAANYLLKHQPSLQVRLLSEGCKWDISADTIDGTYRPISSTEQAHYIETALSQWQYPYEQQVSESTENIVAYLSDTLPFARQHLWEKQAQFGFSVNLNHYIEFDKFTFHFNWQKANYEILKSPVVYQAPYLVFQCDLRLLYWLIKGECHWDNAITGNHINFIRMPNTYIPDVLILMSFFHIKANRPSISVELSAQEA